MCDAASAIAGIAAVVGAGMSYAGQQQQASAYKRQANEQAAYATAQAQLANRQRKEEDEYGQKKRDSIVEEAQAVSPDRVDAINQAQDTQTESNVNALQQANALGDGSVAQTAEGNQSDTYLKARADAAAKQTDKAINLARLFAGTTAANQAVAGQAQNALNYRLDQQKIDSQRKSMQNGYEYLQNALAVDKNNAGLKSQAAAAGAGSGLTALGGAAMNYGLSNLGNSAGGYFGKSATNSQIINNLL